MKFIKYVDALSTAGSCCFFSSNNFKKSIDSVKKKSPSYFYDLRKKKKQQKLFNFQSGKPADRLFQKLSVRRSRGVPHNKNAFYSYFQKKPFRFFKKPFRDFLMNSQFSRRLTVQNYKNSLFYSFVSSKSRFSKKSNNLFFFQRKKFEDKLIYARSVKLNLKRRKKVFSFVFKKIIKSKKFSALLFMFNSRLLTSNFSNFSFSNNFKFNRRVVVNRFSRGFFKLVPSLNSVKVDEIFIKKGYLKKLNLYPAFLLNTGLLKFFSLSPLFSYSVFFFFKHFLFTARRFNPYIGNRPKKKHSLSARRNFFFSINFIISTAFRIIFSKLLNLTKANTPFVSARHLLWVNDNSNLLFKNSNRKSDNFQYSAVRSNIFFNKKLFTNAEIARPFNNHNLFLNSYNQLLFNYLYPLSKARKLIPLLMRNKFFNNYFKTRKYKTLRSARQAFDYLLLSNENSPANLVFHFRKNFVASRLKIWQPRLKKLVSQSFNIYLDPLSNLLFSYKQKSIYRYKKTKFVSILHNKYTIFKSLLKSTYSALAKRSFNILEPTVASAFGTSSRRKFVDLNAKFLSHFLRILLRSTSKEFFDVTADFTSILKSSSFWQFLNLRPILLKTDYSDLRAKEETLLLKGGRGISSDLNSSLVNTNFEKFSEISYAQWLRSVWNVPVVVTSGELLITGDNKTKRFFLGLDRVPRRALIFNNREKNNFSTYYSCNALAFFKLVVFYANFSSSEQNSFFNVLAKLFNKTKQVASTRSSLLFYGKSLTNFKLHNFNKLRKNLNGQNAFFSIKFSKIWFKLCFSYGQKLAKFLFFFTFRLFHLQNRYKLNSPLEKLKISFKNYIFFKGAPQKKIIDFWSTFAVVHRKFKFFFNKCLKIPFPLVLFPCSPYFGPFFKIPKTDFVLEDIRKFVNQLPSRKSYMRLSLSAKQKKLFSSKRFFFEYFDNLLKVGSSNKTIKTNRSIVYHSARAKSCFHSCAITLTMRYFNNHTNRKFAVFQNVYNAPIKKVYREAAFISIFNTTRFKDFNYYTSSDFLNVFFGNSKKKVLFKKLYNLYYHKFAVVRRFRFKLLSSLYSNLWGPRSGLLSSFSSNPVTSFPMLKTRPQRLFKFNPDAKGRDRVFYYLQKKPKFLHKSNKPFRFLRIYTPRINLSSNLLATHGVNRHIVERNARRSIARVARKRKYYLHHVWRKQFNCSSTTLFYKWKCVNETKRKWLTYFLQFENSLANYIWFSRIINTKQRALSAIESGLVYVNGVACLNSNYSVSAGDVISLNNEAYIILVTRRAASYLRRKIGIGAAPINTKKKFLAKIIRLLQKDVAFGTNASVITPLDRQYLIQHAAKFLSTNSALFPSRSTKKFAPGGAKFDFSDVSSADLSTFDVRRVFGDNSMEISYWKKVISRFFKKLDASRSHNGKFYYRFKNHLYVRRYPYSAHEWFASSKRRVTDTYNPLNIETWISHKFWR